MKRSVATLGIATLTLFAAAATSEAADFAGYYPVIIEVETETVAAGDCIKQIKITHPARVVIEKEQHPDWWTANSNDGPKIKWIVSQPNSNYEWTIERKASPDSYRKFFGTVTQLGVEHEASRVKLGGSAAPALADEQYCWYYDVIAEIKSIETTLKAQCRDIGILPKQTLDPQVVFNGGSGTSLLPRACKGDAP